MLQAKRPKFRLLKGSLESGAEYYYFARPSTPAEKKPVKISKTSKSKKAKTDKVTKTPGDRTTRS